VEAPPASSVEDIGGEDPPGWCAAPKKGRGRGRGAGIAEALGAKVLPKAKPKPKAGPKVLTKYGPKKACHKG